MKEEIKKIIEEEIKKYGIVRNEIYNALEVIAMNKIDPVDYSKHRFYTKKIPLTIYKNVL